MEHVIFCAALLGLGYLFYGPWQTQCEDWGRQELFEIRAQLFDMARAGRISFDDPIYKQIRQSMNMMIRFLHELSWVRLGYIRLLRGRQSRYKHSALELAVHGIHDVALRHEVEALTFHMGYVVAKVILLRSPLLLTLAAIAVPVALVEKLSQKLNVMSLELCRKLKQKLYRTCLRIAQRDAEWVGGQRMPAGAAA